MKRYHRLTEHEKCKILSLVEQGIAGKHIAERFDVHVSTISLLVCKRRREKK